MVEVKICGVTTIDDAIACVDAGADAIGLNFWEGSPRCISLSAATQIVSAVNERAVMVGVFVDASEDRISEVRETTGIGWAQLHGDESPAFVQALLPQAYKAMGVPVNTGVAPDQPAPGMRSKQVLQMAGRNDNQVLAEVARYPGAHILLDARVPGAMPGGTGRTFDWRLAAGVAQDRLLTLAGGLTPANVADAVSVVRPFRVDVASGVESSPGRKDMDAVRAFIDAAKSVPPDAA